MRTVTYLLICSLLLFSGCRQEEFSKQLEDDKFQLQKENQQLKRQLKEITEENRQLNQQVNVLTALGPQKRKEGLNELKSIEITKYTNFYDKDKDGTKEKLIVYVQPVDSEGDVVKASGSVEVELWDLNKTEGAKLAQWLVDADDLKKMWFGGFAGSNYRLMFDIVGEVPGVDKPLTVKVVFTDYAFGRLFTEQYLIKP